MVKDRVEIKPVKEKEEGCQIFVQQRRSGRHCMFAFRLPKWRRGGERRGGLN